MSEPRRDRAAARQWRVSAEGVSSVTTRAEWKRKYALPHTLSLRGAKRRGNPFPFHAARKTYCCLEKRRIPTTRLRCKFANWSRDGGIPRFIDLPPSPFRENDSGFLYPAFSFPYWHSLSPVKFKLPALPGLSRAGQVLSMPRNNQRSVKSEKTGDDAVSAEQLNSLLVDGVKDFLSGGFASEQRLELRHDDLVHDELCIG